MATLATSRAAPWDKDLYGYQDLTGSPAAIMAVQLATVARRDDAGSCSLRAVLKSGASTASGARRVLGPSYATTGSRAVRQPVPRGPGLASTRCRPGVAVVG